MAIRRQANPVTLCQSHRVTSWPPTGRSRWPPVISPRARHGVGQGGGTDIHLPSRPLPPARAILHYPQLPQLPRSPAGARYDFSRSRCTGCRARGKERRRGRCPRTCSPCSTTHPMPNASEVLAGFQAMARQPDEVEIQLGVSFDATFGMVIASASSGAHLDVTLRWSGEHQLGPAGKRSEER